MPWEQESAVVQGWIYCQVCAFLLTRNSPSTYVFDQKSTNLELIRRHGLEDKYIILSVGRLDAVMFIGSISGSEGLNDFYNWADQFIMVCRELRRGTPKGSESST